MSKSTLHWIAFGIIFIATQDYLWIGEWPEWYFLGLPVWLYYLAAVHGVFVIMIYLHIKHRDRDAEISFRNKQS